MHTLTTCCLTLTAWLPMMVQPVKLTLVLPGEVEAGDTTPPWSCGKKGGMSATLPCGTPQAVADAAGPRTDKSQMLRQPTFPINPSHIFS